MNTVEGLVLATPVGPLKLKGFVELVAAFSVTSQDRQL
jgi:hypothetical protein